jgi:hypothetical protein
MEHTMTSAELEARIEEIIAQLTRTPISEERKQLINALIETGQQLSELEELAEREVGN